MTSHQKRGLEGTVLPANALKRVKEEDPGPVKCQEAGGESGLVECKAESLGSSTGFHQAARVRCKAESASDAPFARHCKVEFAGVAKKEEDDVKDVQVYFGRVKSYCAQRGWGHIECTRTRQTYGQDVYVARSALKRTSFLTPGDQVSFGVVSCPQGVRAADVQIRVRACNDFPPRGQPHLPFAGSHFGPVAFPSLMPGLPGFPPPHLFNGGFNPFAAPIMSMGHTRPHGRSATPRAPPGQFVRAPPARVLPGMTFHGVVKSYDPVEGCGHIASHATRPFYGPRDIYFNRSSLNEQDVSRGDCVLFKIEADAKGPRATALLVDATKRIQGSLPAPSSSGTGVSCKADPDAEGQLHDSAPDQEGNKEVDVDDAIEQLLLKLEEDIEEAEGEEVELHDEGEGEMDGPTDEAAEEGVIEDAYGAAWDNEAGAMENDQVLLVDLDNEEEKLEEMGGLERAEELADDEVEVLGKVEEADVEDGEDGTVGEQRRRRRKLRWRRRRKQRETAGVELAKEGEAAGDVEVVEVEKLEGWPEPEVEGSPPEQLDVAEIEVVEVEQEAAPLGNEEEEEQGEEAAAENLEDLLVAEHDS